MLFSAFNKKIFLFRVQNRVQVLQLTDFQCLSGERGIRTPGTDCSVRQFSKLVVSATHPPLQVWRTKYIFSNCDANICFIFEFTNVKMKNITIFHSIFHIFAS